MYSQLHDYVFTKHYKRVYAVVPKAFMVGIENDTYKDILKTHGIYFMNIYIFIQLTVPCYLSISKPTVKSKLLSNVRHVIV